MKRFITDKDLERLDHLRTLDKLAILNWWEYCGYVFPEKEEPSAKIVEPSIGRGMGAIECSDCLIEQPHEEIGACESCGKLICISCACAGFCNLCRDKGATNEH